jgi:beta-galactosidase
MQRIAFASFCAVALTFGGSCLAESTADRYLFPGGKDLYVGVDYYPEHWPEERWETDLQLMKQAKFNVVRVAEFSWVLFEPEEGKFDFSWLDRWLELAKKYDIKVIVGTPTAIMPAWLAQKYPQALSLKANGLRTTWGGRRHNCFSDGDFRRLSERIVAKIGEHYANHPQVIGWQIDNELGGNDCRCDKCRHGYQEWLQTRYGSLEEINRGWGTHFWGQRLSSWDQIPIPDERTGEWQISNPSASLDWQRFTSQQCVDFLARQVRLLRDVIPQSQFITHNFMGLHSSIDYYRLAEPLDFVSWDNYPKLSPAPQYDAALSADVMRGLKDQNFLIMEQTAGPLGWYTFTRSPQPGEIRRICYQQLAHGADGQLWFRWRSCTVGREQYWHGLLGHDGEPNRRFHEAAKVAEEFHRLAPKLAGTTVHAEVGILYDFDSIWALQIQNGYPGASHQDAIRRYYYPLYRAGVNVDIVRPGANLSKYKLVLAPHLHVLPDALANQLVEYVRSGGVLLADCRTGVKDETNLAHARTLPGLLASVLGIKIDEYESLRLGIQDHEETRYPLRVESQPDTEYTAIRYADWIVPQGAEVIARYGVPYLKDYAAITRNRFDRGVGWYVGTIVEGDALYDELIARVLQDAGIRPLVHPPVGVEVSVRGNDDRRLLFVINQTEQQQFVNVPPGKTELLSGTATSSKLSLEPFDVAVIELPATGAK